MSTSIGIMTFMEAALNVTSDLQPFVDQLLLVEQLQVRVNYTCHILHTLMLL